MATLDDLVRDLLDRWDGDEQHPGDRGPGLIHRLDSLALRTGQPRETGGHASPGSRPPASIDAVSWSRLIKEEAVTLDAILRGSTHRQRWDRALRAIPPGAENADRVGQAMSIVGTWHSTARTILGLQAPARKMLGVRCLICDQVSIYSRPDEDAPRAWCRNEECQDEETGRPAVYQGQRLFLLTENRAPA